MHTRCVSAMLDSDLKLNDMGSSEEQYVHTFNSVEKIIFPSSSCIVYPSFLGLKVSVCIEKPRFRGFQRCELYTGDINHLNVELKQLRNTTLNTRNFPT